MRGMLGSWRRGGSCAGLRWGRGNVRVRVRVRVGVRVGVKLRLRANYTVRVGVIMRSPVCTRGSGF